MWQKFSRIVKILKIICFKLFKNSNEWKYKNWKWRFQITLDTPQSPRLIFLKSVLRFIFELVLCWFPSVSASPRRTSTVDVLGRPGNFRKLTSSDVLVPVPVLVLAVLVQKILKNPRPRTSSSPSWSSSWPSSSQNSRKSWSSDVLVPVRDLILDVLVLGRPRPGPRPGGTRGYV